ncbi:MULTISPECIES: tyrosine-type recombinase/integrase [unclassified Streptomyces]|uniref:tyrosine-type recombinase/integrase n=1 Tax=unclassified Streptomyces TaxID=2593676 RepID=UPI001F5473D0|nr:MULTISPECIES: tyrosine-type recombinase/integrase [unclassified Streptomyces]
MKAHLRDFPADGPEGRIFTAPQGGPVVYTHFMDGSWRPACAKAGIPKGTGPHALRHHYASLLIKHGESVKTVSERLGHTNAAMTLNIYTHLGPDSEESGPGPLWTRRTRTAKAARPAPSPVRRPFAERIRR